MRPLTAATNIDPASGDYPNGRVRDLNGGAGTLGNEALLGDIIQFFQKLVIDAGITENNLPDNVTNGYQLLEAFEDRFKPSWNTITLINSWAGGSNSARYRVHIDGTVEIDLNIDTDDSGSISDPTLGVLPAGARPPETKCFAISNSDGIGAITPRQLRIDTSGNIDINWTATDLYKTTLRIPTT